ncbi:hypothetical protein [Desulfobacter postgatei]|jgi:hypothetical protein|nr:hypothetical protein [Desulfobacter postgatei]
MNHDLIPSPKNKDALLQAIKEVPEELLWKANFNSDNSIETY